MSTVFYDIFLFFGHNKPSGQRCHKSLAQSAFGPGKQPPPGSVEVKTGAGVYRTFKTNLHHLGVNRRD